MKYFISFIIKTIPRKYLQRVAGIFPRFLSLFYLGKSVQCPICGAQYRSFLPYGRVPRPNALCPNCLSLERHRLIWLYLETQTDFFSKSHKLLHIAPEACFIDRFEKLENLDYVTADLESPLAKVKMDIHEMPFDDNTFDIVFCNHVLEHVDDDLKALSEIYRVLKPGGWAILQVPFFPPIPDETFSDPSVTSASERIRLFGQDDHVRRYGHDYPKRLATPGFKVEENKLAFELTDDVARRNGILKDELLYVCYK